jgi:hypothetical protein
MLKPAWILASLTPSNSQLYNLIRITVNSAKQIWFELSFRI